MTQEISRINRTISYICIGFTMVMLLSIVLRVFTRQILVEKLNMNNAFTNLVLFDVQNLQNEETKSSQTAVNWEELYPFETEQSEESLWVESTGSKEKSRYIRIIDSIEEKIDKYSSDFLMGHDAAVNIAGQLDKSLLWERPVNPKDFERIITMNNGYLTYVQPKVDSEEIDRLVESVCDFKNFLDKKDIPFLVVNAGSKVCPEDMQLSDYEKQFEHTNENGDELLSKLQARDVNTLDLRAVMLKEANSREIYDWYDFYYKTDHHFTPMAGLLAARNIAGKLNEVAKAGFDEKTFDEYEFEQTTYHDIMFGGQGRAVTLAKAQPEDYVMVLPLYYSDLSYEVVEPSLYYEGEYADVIIDQSELEEVRNYKGSDFLYKTDAYNIIRINNYPVSTIKNNYHLCNSGLKILVIQDSFSWYSSSFLALGASRVDMIYPIAFTGSIRNYIEKNQPDVVIFSFCEKAINPIDEQTHQSFFDLR